MRLSAVAASLLIVGSPCTAGTITCSDQVGVLKARLADRPDKAIGALLDDADRLCRERRDAEALALVAKARAAFASSPIDSDRPAPPTEGRPAPSREGESVGERD